MRSTSIFPGCFLVLASLSLGCGGGGGAVVAVVVPLQGPPSVFANWENLGVHPVALTPDGKTLVVCNVPAARLEVFDVSGASPVRLGVVPVGLDPVSVRVRTDTEAWVVNHISDSVSVVDIAALRIVATLQTEDEPADVVFARGRAFVSCSQANQVLVFDPADLAAAPEVIAIEAEDPRALAVSADGATVYVAIFESGNGTTVLGGGIDESLGGARIAFPPNAVNDPAGPHGGVNPPPNAGAAFDPPLRPGNPVAPKVGLIVRQDAGGSWRDDVGADWTALTSGALAARSGRPVGWTLHDRDVAMIDVATGTVSYSGRCMNVCTALAVHPVTGAVTIVGTDATNETRYEPVLSGRFLRVLAASVPAGGGAADIVDLNPHLDYQAPRIPAADRARSLGDPRGIAWHPGGARAYVTGMGSNNIAVLDSDLVRTGRIEVGGGPVGIVLALDGATAYVLNRFENSVSIVDTAAQIETGRVALFDPSPRAVRRGRRHLYDTHETSGLGHVACASCHVDARTDRLAWDLGDPGGEVKRNDQTCLTGPVVPCEDFHPMKGPMLTQTLQDIIGKEPHHWRGDRDGLEEFTGAFVSLLGDDSIRTAIQMQEFEDFLATVRFPPNPFRELDNTLPARLALPGHFTPGRFGPAGQPLQDGDAQRGLAIYRTDSLDGIPGFQCATCHTMPTGIGPDIDAGAGLLRPRPLGPNGERHHSLVSVDGGTNVSMKIPQLRNLYERVGFETTQGSSTAGFGFLHDGSIDSIARFIAEPAFEVRSTRDIADLVAFMLCFSGSDLPEGSPATPTLPPGPLSLDTHAAVGQQVQMPGNEARLATLLALADAGAIDLVAHGGGFGWTYERDTGRFRRSNDVTQTLVEVRAAAPVVVFGCVVAGSGRRLGIDTDDDGFADETEREMGTDPEDPADHP